MYFLLSCVYQEMYSLDSSPDSEDEGIGKKEKKKKKVKKKKKKVSVTEFSKANCRWKRYWLYLEFFVCKYFLVSAKLTQQFS